MAKTTKRIVSLVIVAMMLLAMVPFTASAANTSLTLTMSKDGFTYTVYQVATLNTETGAYTLNTTDAGVVAAMKEKGQTGAAFLAALDAASNPGTNKGTVDKDNSFTTTTLGIYYAKATAWPDNVQRKSNTVVVSQYNSTDKKWEFSSSSIDLATNGKAVSGDVNVDKGFDTVDDKAPKYKAQGDVVTYTLEASVIGSWNEKAQKYVIWDTLSKGLTYNGDAQVYYLDANNTATSAGNDFTVATATSNARLKEEYTGGTYITATLSNLNSRAFYEAKKVRVVYTATVNNAAVVGTPGNPNQDGLEYTNAAGKDGDIDGPVVKVYTYVARAYKVDASNNNTPLAGATIGLYKTEAAAKAGGNDYIASAVTGTDGYAKFIKSGDTNEVRLAPDTYYVRELAAPANYNLNTKAYSVVINASTTSNGVSVNSDAITNTISKLPETGGAGTMMFTIIGGALILVAGALFVVVLKKRSSK